MEKQNVNIESTNVLEEEIIERTIELTINNIGNIMRNEDVDMIISVEHDSNLLGKSEPISIKAGLEESHMFYDVNFSVNIPVSINVRNSINPIVSVPVLMTLSTYDNDDNITPVTENERKKKKTKHSVKSPENSKANVIGLCNVDLIPILLGETTFTEKLVLETPTFTFNANAVSWPNLPYLMITLKQDEPDFFPSNIYFNFLNITIESIFNLPSSFTDNMEYKAGTVLHGEGEDPEIITYEGGKVTEDRDIERTKRWKPLFHLQNRARLSKYKLACNYDDLKNTMNEQLNLKDLVTNEVKRVEFNVMSRHMLQEDAFRKIHDQIAKYKYWPFQFMISEKSVGNTKTKSKDANIKYPIYQCYVDLTELLFPGRTKTRVASQLYTYSSTDLIEKTGFEKNMFSTDIQVKEPKDKDKKGKASTKNTSIITESDVVTSVPLYTENNEPVFVIIEIDIYRPLIACRLTEDFSHLIHEFTTSIPKKPYYPYNGNVAEDQFSKCIETLVNIMTNSYRDFCNEKNIITESSSTFEESADDLSSKQTKFCYVSQPDDLACFVQYMYRKGIYLSMRNALKTKVIQLLDEKFQMPGHMVNFCEGQSFIISAYTYLVELMHTIINKTTGENLMENSTISASFNKLYFYAEEAYELNRMDEAKKYYTTAIEKDKKDPITWTNYAIFLLKTGDLERAEECCRDAILLDDRQKITLLIYGAILVEKKCYREAEIFFRAVTDFHPRFMEGWAILHLFYIRINYYPGINIAFRVAEKCIKNNDQNKVTEDAEPLAWSTIHCPPRNIYMITATFLLKLHLCDLAGIALAQEMSVNGRSTHFLYYLAVQHYLLHRYEDALSHLEEAQCQHGLDYSISCLMGHCYFREGNYEKALELYEFANIVFDRPDNVHLLHLRMGLCYERNNNYEKAKKLFMSACKSSPTCETWLHAGIAFYKLNELVEAEAALMEANQIDNCNADTWGYLCLLNLSLKRYDEFSQCYTQAMKNNLENEQLLNEIREFMKSLNYEVEILKAM